MPYRLVFWFSVVNGNACTTRSTATRKQEASYSHKLVHQRCVGKAAVEIQKKNKNKALFWCETTEVTYCTVQTGSFQNTVFGEMSDMNIDKVSSGSLCCQANLYWTLCFQEVAPCSPVMSKSRSGWVWITTRSKGDLDHVTLETTTNQVK